MDHQGQVHTEGVNQPPNIYASVIYVIYAHLHVLLQKLMLESKTKPK